MTPITLGPLAVIAGLAVPLLTAVFTKLKASRATKSLVTLILATGAGAYQAVLAAPHAGATTKSLITTALATWVVAIASHYGLWEPTTLSAIVQNATANFGIGSNTPPATPAAAPLTYPPAPSADELAALAGRLGLPVPSGVEITPGAPGSLFPTQVAS